jgi:predicted methyltransferase
MQINRSASPYSVDAKIEDKHDEAVFYIARARILNFLFIHHTATLNEIINETNVSLNSLAKVFSSTEHVGVLSRTDNGLSITSTGIKWVIKNRKEIFMRRFKVVYEAPSEPNGLTTMIRNVEHLPKKYSMSD